jgi:hypothetical protein
LRLVVLSFTTSWPGVTDLITATPTAWLLTCSVKVRTTADPPQGARRTSRSAHPTSASVSAPAA